MKKPWQMLRNELSHLAKALAINAIAGFSIGMVVAWYAEPPLGVLAGLLAFFLLMFLSLVR